MDSVLAGAIIAGLSAVVVALCGLWGTRSVERTKQRTAENTSAIEVVNLKMDYWQRLDAAHLAEIDRLQAKVDRLEEELAACFDRAQTPHNERPTK